MGLKGDKGLELLVDMGLETVELEGEGLIEEVCF
ncbi:hypothetical protein [Staphylococcus aureus]